MRIALDEQIFAVQEYGGISRMFAELAEQFATQPDLDVIIEPLHAPVINHYVLDDPRLTSSLDVRPARNHLEAFAYYFLHRRRTGTADVAHGTFYLPRGLFDYPGVPKVMTVHDMIPEIFPQTRRRLDFVTLKRRYVNKVDHIICVSEWTRSDLERIYGPIDVPITVVHHGVDAIFRPDAPELRRFPDEYVVFVGNRGSYKDATTLLRAFAQIHDEFPNLRLMFIGGGPLTGTERRAIADAGLNGYVAQVSLSETEMPSAYAHARLVVFPSRYEGFGLPALEGMASGTPVILAQASSLPEIGGDAAAYFTPGDSGELADRMRWLLTDSAECDRLIALGLARAQGFTWHRAAEHTAQVYAQTIAASRG